MFLLCVIYLQLLNAVCLFCMGRVYFVNEYDVGLNLITTLKGDINVSLDICANLIW